MSYWNLNNKNKEPYKIEEDTFFAYSFHGSCTASHDSEFTKEQKNLLDEIKDYANKAFYGNDFLKTTSPKQFKIEVLEFKKRLISCKIVNTDDDEWDDNDKLDCYIALCYWLLEMQLYDIIIVHDRCKNIYYATEIIGNAEKIHDDEYNFITGRKVKILKTLDNNTHDDKRVIEIAKNYSRKTLSKIDKHKNELDKIFKKQ